MKVVSRKKGNTTIKPRDKEQLDGKNLALVKKHTHISSA